jgi:hypothetical protein
MTETQSDSALRGVLVDGGNDTTSWKSVANLTGFIPFGYQSKVIRFINDFDYSIGTPEILLSGAFGSAKSTLMAHIALVHCLEFPGARVGIGRRTLPDLKKTLFNEIIEHMAETPLIEGVHYWVRYHTAEIEFCNGSKIESVTWGDKRYKKFRSLKFSALFIEELTENDDEFESGFKQLKARLRRVPGIRQNFLMAATNPDEPDSFWHTYFIEGSEVFATRFVFYSRTLDNPYLDPIYHEQQLNDLSPLEAERFLEGKWVSIVGKGIYHAWRDGNNLIKTPFQPDKRYAIHICFDFNTADGKPQSACIFQILNGIYHVFAESIIENANWCLDNLDDFSARGIFEGFHNFVIHGDATGRARSANSLHSNYDLICNWFAQRNMNCKLHVPRSNPPLVTRWTVVNAMCQNAKKDVRLFVYPDCPTLAKGMKMSRRIPGTALEDDKKKYQHVTTALGYGICYTKSESELTKTKVINL